MGDVRLMETSVERSGRPNAGEIRDVRAPAGASNRLWFAP